MTGMNQLSENSEMRYQGIIFNLKKFYGEIMVKNNTFDSLQFKFAACDIINANQTRNETYLWKTGNFYQGKALFYHKNSSNIQFVDNNFTNCNSAIGLIYITRSGDESTVLIHGNQFIQNSALFGANVIRLNLEESVGYQNNLLNTMV
jgi:nitrous oxidase accessory protein NosD